MLFSVITLINKLLDQGKLSTKSEIMKKIYFLVTIIFLAGTACQERIDIDKEKEAIKAVIEAEKEAYYSCDYPRIAETWIQDPSSYKIYLNQNGNSIFESWEAISKHDQQNVQDTSWDRSQLKMDFSNYRINIIENTAWVLFDCYNNGINQGDTISILNTRIYVLRKVEGRWRFSLMAMTVY